MENNVQQITRCTILWKDLDMYGRPLFDKLIDHFMPVSVFDKLVSLVRRNLPESTGISLRRPHRANRIVEVFIHVTSEISADLAYKEIFRIQGLINSEWISNSWLVLNRLVLYLAEEPIEPKTMIASFNKYQELAERTAGSKTERDRYLNYSMGLAGEAGEVINYLKKVHFHGHPLDKEKLKDELGDCLWYIATLATTAGLSLEDIATSNIEKLARRYPDGFSSEKSIHREAL